MKYLKNSKLFSALVFIICIGIILALYQQVSFVFLPIQAFFASIFTPILIAIFIFYIFLPVYKFILKKVKTEKIALPLIFIIIIGVFYFLVSSLLPSLLDQIQSFLAMVPTLVTDIVNWIEEILAEYNISSSQIYQSLYELDVSITDILSNILDSFTSGISSIISLTISTAITIFVVPFILYFCFKEGDKFPKQLLKFIPKKYKKVTNDLMAAFHRNAAQYIGGRMLVIIYVAIASYVVFLILNIPNAMLLAMITGILDIIPYFGPWLGAAPAFFVALSISPTTAFILVLLIFLIQQGESYLVTPLVMGKTLDMHPITVMLLVLFANEIAGILGMILALPIYAILKSCGAVIIEFIKKTKREENKIEQID